MITRKRVYQLSAITILVSAVGLMCAGAAALGGFGAAIRGSNSLAFCTSCHEMHDNNYAEYKDTIHSQERRPA